MSAAITDSSPPGQFYCPTCEKNFEIGDRCPTDGTRLVKINVPVDPLLGRELDRRYMIVQKLGQGGMGAVYRGTQLGLGREVAIKVVSAHLVTEPDVVKRFLREAKLASRLSHPNAVAVLDFNQTDDGLFYLVMELVSGRTLDKVFEEEHVLRTERLVRIGAQVCDALEGAHSLQIVHRDLKPSNIMLLDRGRDLVKVLDFGLAKSVAPDQTTTTMTNAGALLGTPAFMPPELALGQPCDGRADLYSLGVVLYLLGSGRLPFVSDSAHELIAMHAAEPAPPMAGVPAALADVIDRMLRKDPAERYQSAAENREALEAALDAVRTATPPAGVRMIDPPSIAAGVRVPAAPTPLPESLIDARRAPSRAELHALATGETVAPGVTSAPTPVPLTAAKPRPRWLIPLVLAGGIVASVVGYVATQSSAKSTPAPAAETTAPAPMTTTAPQPQPPPPQQPAAQPPIAGDAGAPEMTVHTGKDEKPPGKVTTKPKKVTKPDASTVPAKPATPTAKPVTPTKPTAPALPF